MKKNHLIIILIALTVSLSACSSTTKNKKMAEENQTIENDAIPYSEIVECIDDLHLLEKLNRKQYLSLSKNYIYITSEFEFLRANENIMDMDSNKYLKYKLNMKMSSLCNKVKYLSFVGIKNKTSMMKMQ